MNKKELIKLLMEHSEIRNIVKSKQFSIDSIKNAILSESRQFMAGEEFSIENLPEINGKGDLRPVQYMREMEEAIKFKISKREEDYKAATTAEGELVLQRGEAQKAFDAAQKAWKPPADKSKKNDFPETEKGIELNQKIEDIQEKIEEQLAIKKSSSEKKRFHELVLQNYVNLKENVVKYLTAKRQKEKAESYLKIMIMQSEDITKLLQTVKDLKKERQKFDEGTEKYKEADEKLRAAEEEYLSEKDSGFTRQDIAVEERKIQAAKREMDKAQVLIQQTAPAFEENRRHYIDRETGLPFVSAEEVEDSSEQPAQSTAPDMPIEDPPEEEVPSEPEVTPEQPAPPKPRIRRRAKQEPESPQGQPEEPEVVEPEEPEVVEPEEPEEPEEPLEPSVPSVPEEPEEKTTPETVERIADKVEEEIPEIPREVAEKAAEDKEDKPATAALEEVPVEQETPLEDIAAAEVVADIASGLEGLVPAESMDTLRRGLKAVNDILNRKEPEEAVKDLEQVKKDIEPVIDNIKPTEQQVDELEELGIEIEDSEMEVNLEDQLADKISDRQTLIKTNGMFRDKMKDYDSEQKEAAEKVIEQNREKIKKIDKEIENLKKQIQTQGAVDQEPQNSIQQKVEPAVTSQPEEEAQPEPPSEPATQEKPEQTSPPEDQTNQFTDNIPSPQEVDQVIPTPAENTTIATRGWRDAKRAVIDRLRKGEVKLQQIEQSLQSVEDFKNFWGVRGGEEAKLEQARTLFEGGYVKDQLERIRGIQQDQEIKDAPVKEVVEQTTNLAATVMGFYQFLEAASKTQPVFSLPEGFQFPDILPTSEEQFKNAFIEPIEKEIETIGIDYEAIGNQVLQLSPDLLSEKKKSISGIVEFIGWYVASRSKNLLQEGIEVLEGHQAKVRGYKGTNYKKILADINGDTEEWKEIFDKLDELVSSGKINIESEAEEVETDTKLIAAQAIEEAPKVEPETDADLSPLEQAEMDSAWKETLDAFFGKDQTRPSFMKRLLLRDQATMLYGVIEVLNNIISGGRPEGEMASYTDVEDNFKPQPEEAGSDAEQLQEAIVNEIFNIFSNKKEGGEPQEIEISNKTKSLMRQDLEAMVDLLQSLKSDIEQYKKYSTSSSADPRFDGSTLKRAMDKKLEAVQVSIGFIIKKIDVELQNQKNELESAAQDVVKQSPDQPEEEQELQEDFSFLFEEDDSDRKLKIQEVRRVYEEMRRMYLKGLRVSLEENNAIKSKEGATQIKNYLMSEEEFMGYFPSNIVTSSGKVMTLGKAHEVMTALIRVFVETIRDMVTITRTQSVSEPNLQQSILDLIAISEEIEETFMVKSQIDRDFLKKFKKQTATDEDNQSLTNEEDLSATPYFDKEGDLMSDEEESRLTSLLKKKFDWLTSGMLKLIVRLLGPLDILKYPKLFANLIEPFGELMVKSTGPVSKKTFNEIKPKEVEELFSQTLESKSWFESLKEEERQVVNELVESIYRNSDILNEVDAGIVPSEVRSQISDRYQIILLKSLMKMEKDKKELVTKLMRENEEEFVKYLVNQHKLRVRMSKENVEKINSSSIPSSKTRPSLAGKPATPEEGPEYTSSTKTAVAKALKQLVDINSILRDSNASKEDRNEALIASKYYFIQVATDRRKTNVPSDLSESSSGDDGEKGSNRPLADLDREEYISNIPEKYAEILEKNEELVKDIEFYVETEPWNDPDLRDIYGEVDLEESLKPIIEKMLKEHYNY